VYRLSIENCNTINVPCLVKIFYYTKSTSLVQYERGLAQLGMLGACNGGQLAGDQPDGRAGWYLLSINQSDNNGLQQRADQPTNNKV